jgi:hypothetical protein
VRIWYHPSIAGAQAKAELIAFEMDLAIWGDLTGLMQKTPVADCGAGCPSGGGSPSLDIYISGTPVRAYTQWNPPATTTCENTASFIVLDQGDSAAIAAHEFMHALQFAFPYAAGNGCTEPDWWWEATAQWAIDFVYPTGSADGPPHEEQSAAKDLLDVPGLPLEFSNDKHEYAAYLLAFYVARQYGKPEFVRHSFQQMAGEADSLSALDKALAAVGLEGFSKVWHEFAVQNWNQEPVDDYKAWDSLTKTAALAWTLPFEVNLSGSLDYDNRLDELKNDGLKHLSASYYHFKFTDDDVRTVIFNNGWSYELNEEVDPLLGTWYQAKDSSDPDKDKVKVQALVKIGGVWQGPEDWSALQQRHFCRDKIGERVEELVLVFSNAQFADRNKTYKAADKPPTLWTSNMACWKWTGLVTFDATVDGVTTTMTGNVTMDPFPQSWYSTGTGSIDWNTSGIDSGGCIHTGSQTVSIDTDPTYTRYLVTFNNYTAGNFHRGYEAFGYAYGQVTEDISCPDGEGGWDEFQSIYDLGMWLQGQSDVAFKVGQGGDQIDGVFIDLGGGNARWEWHLNAQRESPP